jgi:hypothetical protein
VSCSNLRKPVLARNPVGALRYAWLRAPPSRPAKTNPNLSEALTHKSPYEGGVGVLPQYPLVAGDKPPPAALRASTSPASGRGEVKPLKGRFNQESSRCSGQKSVARPAFRDGTEFAPT